MVSILRSRTHKFKHESLTAWLMKANVFVQNILKQWLEDASLLETMLKTWISHGPLLAKGSIMDIGDDKKAMRQALTTNKNFRPLKNGTALLAKWREGLKALHLDVGLPNGQQVLTSLGQTINVSLEFTDLTEMCHEVLQINEQKNNFLRKADANKFRLRWKSDQMGESIAKALELLLGDQKLEISDGQDAQLQPESGSATPA